MVRFWLLALTLALLASTVAVPAAAKHVHTTSIPYTAGASVQNGNSFSFGPAWCLGIMWDLGLGCLGGGTLQSEHGSYYNGGEDDWDNGYTRVEVTVLDALTGPNAGFSVCLKAQGDDSLCQRDDPFVRGCGIALTADTSQGDHGSFRTVYATVFVRGLYVDLTTNEACVGTQGTITGLWG